MLLFSKFTNDFIRRTTKVSQQALNKYNKIVQDTVYELNVRLQRIDEKLQGYPKRNVATSSVNLKDENELSLRCLRICEETKQFLESLNQESTVLEDGQGATGSMSNTASKHRYSHAKLLTTM